MNNYIYGLGCFLCLPKVLLDSNPRDSNTLPKMVVHLLLTFNLMDASHFFLSSFLYFIFNQLSRKLYILSLIE